MKRIVLFYPALTNGGDAPTLYVDLPLSVVTLAAQFDPAEFEVEIVDERLGPCTPGEIARKCAGALFVGISAITSYQIVNGLRIARAVRDGDKAVPIVWGGWHPSLMPQETIAHPLVDMVMVGQGEQILPLLARCLARGDGLDSVPNLWWKQGGRVVRNPRREYPDFQMPRNLIEGYRRLDLTPYVHPQWGHRRVIGYESSRGCPFACAFCSISAVFERRWYGLEAARVAGDIAWLKKQYDIDAVHFFDNNFFIDRQRAADIARLFIERGLDIAWDGTVVAQQFVRFSPAEIDHLRESGLFRVILGGESGDEEVLRRIHKQHTNEQMLESVRICREYDLLPSLSFMVGFPWDPAGDVRRTISLIEQIKRIEPRTEILLFLFSPYLGTPLYEVAKDYGMVFPASLEGWAGFTYDKANTPWITPALSRKISRYLAFFGTKELSGEEEAFFRGFEGGASPSTSCAET